MELREAWKKLETEKLISPVAGPVVVPDNSKHPVSKLIFNFKMGLAFIVFFEVIFLVVFFLVSQPIVKIGMGAVVCVYTLLFIINFRIFRKLLPLANLHENILRALTEVHSVVTQALSFQQKMSAGFFPVCVAAGFLSGLSVENDAAVLMENPAFPITMFITIAIFTPICYYLTKWMNRLAYGQYLEQLQEQIEEIRNDPSPVFP
jgi:hypothetical protein